MGHYQTRPRGSAASAAVALVATVALAATACGSSGAGHTAAGRLSAPATTAQATSGAAPPSVRPASVQTPSPTTPPAAVTPPGATAEADTTTSPPASCASLATRTFLHLTSVKPASGGGLTLTANPATLVCGGVDDLHYDVATTTLTAHLVAGATIQVFPVSNMSYKSLPASGLASYLATDGDTRIFLVTGPLSAITALTEQFHP